jgi:hypothetical protein
MLQVRHTLTVTKVQVYAVTIADSAQACGIQKNICVEILRSGIALIRVTRLFKSRSSYIAKNIKISVCYLQMDRRANKCKHFIKTCKVY